MEKSQKEKASLEGLSKSVRARLEHQNFSPIRWVHKVYKVTLSPLFACFGAECRFIPDCSSYALDAIESRGFLHGGMLAVRRLCRCHPWCAGGHDPVPREAVSDIRFVSPDIRNQVNSCRDPCKISS